MYNLGIIVEIVCDVSRVYPASLLMSGINNGWMDVEITNYLHVL